MWGGVRRGTVNVRWGQTWDSKYGVGSDVGQ